MELTKISNNIHIPETILIPAYVMPIETISSNAERIQLLLEQDVNTSDMNNIGDVLQELSREYAYIPEMVASSKFYYSALRKVAYDKAVQKVKSGQIPKDYSGFTSSTNLKQYISDKCADVEWLFTFCERLNSSVTHRCDALRSLLSKEKEVFKSTQYASSGNV